MTEIIKPLIDPPAPKVQLCTSAEQEKVDQISEILGVKLPECSKITAASNGLKITRTDESGFEEASVLELEAARDKFGKPIVKGCSYTGKDAFCSETWGSVTPKKLTKAREIILSKKED